MLEKTYKECIQLPTFEERYNYLRLFGKVGVDTFGHDRIFNQLFYRASKEWEKVRRDVIVRDNGCDLAIPDRAITGKVFVHHINPWTMDDLRENPELLLDPNNLICVSFETHNAIHYGDERQLLKDYEPRKSGDTKLW